MGRSRSCRVGPISPFLVALMSLDQIRFVPVADLHYSVGTGECRDSDKEPCSGDPDTATWLADALDSEQPDLVVS